MIIKIDNNYITDIFNNGLSGQELFHFTRLFQAMYEKRLFVRADNRKFYKWMLDNHPTSFSDGIRGVLQKLYSDYTTIMSDVLKIDYLYVVTKNTRRYCNDSLGLRHCYIPIYELPNELSPYFYAENDEDAKFYFRVFKEHNKRMPIFIHCRGFGGGSGKSVISALIEDKTVFFALDDSDKNYKGANWGDTARGISKLFETLRLYWSHLVLSVREKENLLPIESIRLNDAELTPVLRFLKANHDNDVKEFFDIKSGIDKTKFAIKKTDAGWWAINKQAIEYLENVESVAFANQNEKGIDGVGKSFITTLMRTNKIDYSNIFNYCTSTQISDWTSIFAFIAKYGYCYNYSVN